MKKLLQSQFLNADIGILILRLWIGAMFIWHGSSKLFGGMEPFTGMLDHLGVPLPVLAGYLAALAEFGGGILLIIGLYYRVAAFLILIVMIVALTTAHVGDPLSKIEKPLTFGVTMVSFILFGAGRFSLDRLLFRTFKR